MAMKRSALEIGDVVVIGVVGLPRKPGYFEPINAPGKDQWFRMEPTAMAKRLGLKRVAAYWVTADTTLKPKRFPIGVGGTHLPHNNHLGYALTWYGMALGLLLLSIAYWRQERR
jgi:surfeit locus 1 family protein